MRDDRHLWSPLQPLDGPFDLGAANLHPVRLERQTLISGPAVNSDRQAKGWPDIASGPVYRICLRRDRVVEIGGPPRPEGWDNTSNTAVSDVTSGYAVFDLCGATAIELLSRGTEISLDQPSPSVVRHAFELELWLYRYQAEDCVRLHVSRAHADTLVQHLQRASDLAR